MRTRLGAEILEIIQAGPDGYLSDEDFNDYAIQLFRHHYVANPIFHEYCEGRKVSPSSVDYWGDVPAVWSDAFKTHLVASFPLEQAVFAVMTGGTTSLTQRGRVFRDELGMKLILTANRVLTKHYLFPDFDEGARCRILLMAPSTKVAPSMGMAIGMEQTKEHFGTEDSAFLLKRTGIDVKALMKALRESEESGVPVALVGATAAYVYFMRSCQKKGISFSLPAGSRVCDGGGYRGRFGPITRDEYYALVLEIFGIPANWCVNVLGEGETASNYFDDVILRTVRDMEPRERIKPAHPWSRVRCASVKDLSILPDGEIGLVQIFDLANVPTVLAVQSDDLGYTKFGGVEMAGRAMVESGRVVAMPDEPPAGVSGDTPMFRLLENYINFSIDFGMLGTRAKKGAEGSGRPGQVPRPPVSKSLDPTFAEVAEMDIGDVEDDMPAPSDLLAPSIREEVDHAGEGAVPSCPQVVDELIMSGEEPEAKRLADEAMATFAEQETRPLSEYQAEWERQREARRKRRTKADSDPD
ncbi:MAG: acyl-protein synthetase [Coriobacteriia bacterium]|nr:acyl-protein synthetase [Coriobacteriia bacterium]